MNIELAHGKVLPTSVFRKMQIKTSVRDGHAPSRAAKVNMSDNIYNVYNIYNIYMDVKP